MKRDNTLSAVFDCMVYLQAALNESGPAGELLRYAERGEISLFVSRGILNEVLDVLSRPKVILKNPFITSEFVEAFLIRISNTTKYVRSFPSHFSFLRDPKDEKYLNLAIEVEADYLVSRDNDLRELMTSHDDQAKEFRQKFRTLKIVSPDDFLSFVREKNASQSNI